MKKRNRKPRRLLYRRGVTRCEIDQLVAEIGPLKLLEALDRLTQPDHTFVA
jgi:hypothetical protein